MRNQNQNENVPECFYIDLKDPIGVFIPELHLTIPFSGTGNVEQNILFLLKNISDPLFNLKNLLIPPFDLRKST